MAAGMRGDRSWRAAADRGSLRDNYEGCVRIAPWLRDETEVERCQWTFRGSVWEGCVTEHEVIGPHREME